MSKTTKKPLVLIVTGYTPPAMFDTTVTFTGIHESYGELRFVADHRPARDIIKAVEAGEFPLAEVPSWAVLG